MCKRFRLYEGQTGNASVSLMIVPDCYILILKNNILPRPSLRVFLSHGNSSDRSSWRTGDETAPARWLDGSFRFTILASCTLASIFKHRSCDDTNNTKKTNWAPPPPPRLRVNPLMVGEGRCLTTRWWEGRAAQMVFPLVTGMMMMTMMMMMMMMITQGSSRTFP